MSKGKLPDLKKVGEMVQWLGETAINKSRVLIPLIMAFLTELNLRWLNEILKYVQLTSLVKFPWNKHSIWSLPNKSGMKATSFSRVTSLRQTTCLHQLTSLSLRRPWLALLNTTFPFLRTLVCKDSIERSVPNFLFKCHLFLSIRQSVFYFN